MTKLLSGFKIFVKSFNKNKIIVVKKNYFIQDNSILDA